MKKLHILMLSGAFLFGGCKATEEKSQEVAVNEQSSEEVQTAEKIKNLEWKVKCAGYENKELQDKNQILKWTSIVALSSIVLNAIANPTRALTILDLFASSGAFIYSTYDTFKD